MDSWHVPKVSESWGYRTVTRAESKNRTWILVQLLSWLPWFPWIRLNVQIALGSIIGPVVIRSSSRPRDLFSCRCNAICWGKTLGGCVSLTDTGRFRWTYNLHQRSTIIQLKGLKITYPLEQIAQLFYHPHILFKGHMPSPGLATIYIGETRLCSSRNISCSH